MSFNDSIESAIDGEEVQTEVEEHESDEGSENQNEPADLAEAMRMLRMGKQNGPEESDEDQEEGPGEDDGDDGDRGESGSEYPDGAEEDGDGEDDRADLEPDGVPAAGVQGYDYDAAKNDLIKSVSYAARRAVDDAFGKKGIRRLSINDLYEVDESGRATFKNPDNPNRPFENRQDAQAWINSWNDQVGAAYKQAYESYRKEYSKQMAPTARMLAFAPKAEKMDEDTLAVFDDIISGYEIKDNVGNVRGYRCDLDAAHAQAVRIVERMRSRHQKPKPSDDETKGREGGGPAVDIKASGSRKKSSDSDQEPKNLAEALMMYQKKQRKGK